MFKNFTNYIEWAKIRSQKRMNFMNKFIPIFFSYVRRLIENEYCNECELKNCFPIEITKDQKVFRETSQPKRVGEKVGNITYLEDAYENLKAKIIVYPPLAVKIGSKDSIDYLITMISRNPVINFEINPIKKFYQWIYSKDGFYTKLIQNADSKELFQQYQKEQYELLRGYRNSLNKLILATINLVKHISNDKTYLILFKDVASCDPIRNNNEKISLRRIKNVPPCLRYFESELIRTMIDEGIVNKEKVIIWPIGAETEDFCKRVFKTYKIIPHINFPK